MDRGTSRDVVALRDRELPEPGHPAGYLALLERYSLQCLPPRIGAVVAERHHPRAAAGWLLLTPRHSPPDTLAGHLEFALKWEGVDLGVLAALFAAVEEEEVAAVVRAKPQGVYTRRIWFLYEWLTGRTLDGPAPGKVRAVQAVNPTQQFALSRGDVSSRHRVVNNLPGTAAFCPLVRRTPELDRLAAIDLGRRGREVIGRTHPDVVARAAAFLLLSDSRSSFQIEGERPSLERAARWGAAIGQAGTRPLNRAELERLQQVVIGDSRFVPLGLRAEGGFVGSRDRVTQQPLPDHVSARPQDLASLVDGIVAFAGRALAGGMDPVVTAASTAFGFVYVHPFVDGNGRLHRWLIHHVLAAAGYNPPGVVFPVSAAILREISLYRQVLEDHSARLLPFIRWRATESGNVDVLNDTATLYRYFDATIQAEFLYRCVEATVERDLPEEVAYLEAYDRFTRGVQEVVDMPQTTVDLLHRFLNQGGGKLSNRALSREFSVLRRSEVERIEGLYANCFGALRRTAGEKPGPADA